MSDVLNLLRTARDLIADPAHWSRYAEARDAGNQSVAHDNPGAVRWCVTGALLQARARLGLGTRALTSAYWALSEVLGARPQVVNDALGHARVLRGLDAALGAPAAPAAPDRAPGGVSPAVPPIPVAPGGPQEYAL